MQAIINWYDYQIIGEGQTLFGHSVEGSGARYGYRCLSNGFGWKYWTIQIDF